jgi:hypothetical protein
MLKRALLSMAVTWALPAFAQIQFPSNPQNTQQCEDAYARAKHLANQYHERAVAYIEQRNAVERQRRASCSGLVGAGNNRYWQCVEPYDQRIKQIHVVTSEAFAERDRITRAAHQPYMSCMQMAKAHEHQVAEQKRIAEENQRRQHQAQQQAQQENERRQREADRAQREAQAENERRQREIQAQQERQQREYQAQMQRQNQAIAQQQQAQQQAIAEQQRRDYASRQQQAQQQQQQRQEDRQARVVGAIEALTAATASRNEPRVIAEIPPSGFEPSRRIVQTPQMAAQSRLDSLQAETAVRQEEGKVLRDMATYTAGSYLYARDPDSKLGEKGAEMALEAGASLRATGMDATFNRQGYSDPTINSAFEQAGKAGEQIDKYRGTSPVATQVREDAMAGTKSIFNNTAGQMNQMVSSLDQLSVPAPSSSYSPPSSYSSGGSASQVTSLDQLAAAPLPSPADACKTIATTFARDQCVVDQCRLNRFQSHQICRSLRP